MRITWLGQGGFLLEAGAARLAVDPYLSDALAHKGLERLVPAPMTPAQLAPTLVVFTHDHDDHFDPVTVEETGHAHPDCLYAGPADVVSHALEMGLPEAQCTTLEVGDELTHEPFVIRPVPAEHSSEAIGFVIEAGGVRVYISGDTLYNEGLAPAVERAAGGRVDLALICINGKWGNMNAEEALKVLAPLKPRAAAPMHHELFASNSADPEPFFEGAQGLGIIPCEFVAGRPVDLADAIGAG
ncbi:MAG: MBL fold metallo-hydrolase [Planctomycetota bacterium]|jgi:L-ascorbate 6-phosphate lactonase